ncbi:hypothetical protein ACJJTC_008648 [Scirpophaga incertulas]
MLDVANIFRTEKSLEDSLIRSNNTANQSEILNNTHSNIQCDRSRIACKSPSCIGLKGPHTTSRNWMIGAGAAASKEDPTIICGMDRIMHTEAMGRATCERPKMCPYTPLLIHGFVSLLRELWERQQPASG